MLDLAQCGTQLPDFGQVWVCDDCKKQLVTPDQPKPCAPPSHAQASYLALCHQAKADTAVGGFKTAGLNRHLTRVKTGLNQTALFFFFWSTGFYYFSVPE